MKDFFNKYKVLIFGLFAAIALPISDLLISGETTWTMIALSVVTAAGSYIARNLRGQWVTIAGAVGNAFIAILTQIDSGNPISFKQVVAQALLLFLAIVSPAAKSRGYEHSDTILVAKAEGESKTPTELKP